MVPAVGSRNFVIRLKQVVLPAPFGPIRAWMVPRRTLRLTFLTAVKPWNSLVSPCVCSTYSSAIECSSGGGAEDCGNGVAILCGTTRVNLADGGSCVRLGW